MILQCNEKCYMYVITIITYKVKEIHTYLIVIVVPAAYCLVLTQYETIMPLRGPPTLTISLKIPASYFILNVQSYKIHIKIYDSGGIRTHAISDWCLKPAP